MSNIAKIIGERLRNYRLQSGYSQDVLAERAGVHPTYIGQLERGEKNATLESIEKIAQALNLPLEKLFEHLSPDEDTSSIASDCYRLIQSKGTIEQKQLFEIIKMIDAYKDK
ncbi:MAG: helix-turn-helix transcriptional regulator [Ethanoligenens sp.]